MKRITRIVLCMALVCRALVAQAANEIYSQWDASLQPVVPVGNVYTVTTAAELAWIAAQNTSFAGKTIELNAHIDLQGKRWTPIGSSAMPFQGTFKGKGHLIKGLRSFEGADGVGLFGYVGASGVIDNVGISGGTIVAKNKRRIGAIAGVCAGKVQSCWSMAYMAAAGNVVGGLVGELTSTGVITHAYHSGLINNASDTIGGIVGKSAGKLTQVYNTGYAKNGKALVGLDQNGTYTKCYYDRKLYFQESGITGDQQTPVDVTTDMFGIFAGEAYWLTKDNAYPVLTAFATTDAASLSAAPMFIDISETNPVNHANDLTNPFIVSTEGGITWTCQDERSKQWIQISDNFVGVVRPCSETDVLVDSKLGMETRVVYMRPRRLDDLLPGYLVGGGTFCQKTSNLFAESALMQTAMQGSVGTYHYRVIRYEITATDTVPVDTLLMDADEGSYVTWFYNGEIPTNQVGHFWVRSFVHDEGCVQDWKENPTGFDYTVAPLFQPGRIVSGRDTLMLTTNPVYVSVQSKTLSHGGAGTIRYWWNVSKDNNDSLVIQGENKPQLTNYPITAPGVYRFTRGTSDSLCGGSFTDYGQLGIYTCYVFDAFDPGEIKDKKALSFCTVDEAKATIIRATAAKGGVEDQGYSYQWYTVNGTDTTAISGATSRNLDLNTVTLQDEHSYTFVRKAKDNTRFTSLTLSRYSATVEIAKHFERGQIVSGVDTLILTTSPMYVDVFSKTLSKGGVGTISYWWNVSIDNADSVEIPGATTPDLVNYAIWYKGQYRFTRGTRDSLCGYDPTNLEQLGTYIYRVFDPLDAGKITNSGTYTYCTLAEAKELIIRASAAKGGVEDKGYSYQWYNVIGTDTTAITGATSRNLDLSTIGLRSGRTYTLVRKVKDNTRFTKFTLSANVAIVTIAKEVEAGGIPDGALTNYCAPFDATGAALVNVTIEPTAAAHGEDGLEYHWYRILGTDTLEVGNTATLHYSFPLADVPEGTVYTYIRKVNNPGCDLVQSDGVATQYYGQETRGYRTVTICSSELPYTMEWYDPAGGTKLTHTFKNPTDTWKVSDTSGKCPKDTVISIDTVAVPSFTMDTLASLCQNTSTLSLYVKQIEGTSNVFHIEYSPDLAKYMGKPDTTGVIPASGWIEFADMPNIGTGDMYLSVRAGFASATAEGVCYGRMPQKVKLDISLGGYVYSKYNRVLFVDNNPENGAIPETAEKLKFVAYQWYKDRVMQVGQTGQYYHEDGRLLSGVYYVVMTDTKGIQYRSCEISMPQGNTPSAPQYTSVYPIPVSAGEALTIEGARSVVICSFSGEYVAGMDGTDNTLTIAAPHAAGIYFVQLTTPDGAMEMHKLIVK